MGIRIVKTVTNELVKLKRESIWEPYKVIQNHSTADNHIFRWIQIILRSMQSSGPQPSSMSSQGLEQEIRQIVTELSTSSMFESAIPKLYNFLELNPQIELNDYIKNSSATF